ncbi:MAG: zinc metalloprotease HtpX [Chloroflexi bacterium]|nr:zinc metalloprotease HtpX [Chloroflexota bacterium]
MIGGPSGMVVALMFALLMNFISYWFSDSIALKMSGAQEVSPAEAPDLHRMVEQLAGYARMPKPRVYVIQSDTPNAFATGRDPAHGAVAVTTGIARLLSPDALAGVIAHELAHIRNRDTLIATVVATMAGAITMLAHMAQWALMFGGFARHGDEEEGGGLANIVGGLLLVILAPIAAMLIQMAISRAREFQADAIGARIVGNPLPLADALERLEAGVRMRPADVNPATAHLYIVNPLHGGISGLFSTHPSTAERVQRLRDMALRPSAYGMGS